MRKPRPFESGQASAAIWADVERTGPFGVDAEAVFATADECERLAAWLLKAAEWIREKDGK